MRQAAAATATATQDTSAALGSAAVRHSYARTRAHAPTSGDGDDGRGTPVVVRTTLEDGTPCWRIPSNTHLSTWYVVAFDAARSRLTCTCPAGRFGRAQCRHVAAIIASLVCDQGILDALSSKQALPQMTPVGTKEEEGHREDAGAAAAEGGDEERWTLTGKGQAYLDAQRRERAPLLRDNTRRPASSWMWK